MARKSASRSKRKAASGVSWIALAALLGSGCRPPERFQKLADRLEQLGERLGFVVPAPSAPPPAPAASSVEPEFESVKARAAKANAEILKEMISVVLQRDPKDR